MKLFSTTHIQSLWFTFISQTTFRRVLSQKYVKCLFNYILINRCFLVLSVISFPWCLSVLCWPSSCSYTYFLYFIALFTFNGSWKFIFYFTLFGFCFLYFCTAFSCKTHSSLVHLEPTFGCKKLILWKGFIFLKSKVYASYF